ncbi:MAG: hypothetical protein DRJ01_09850 [Bacteroidetes bacterium]|nr:MAG: hypothetical protein DRJ01_09850 [Bacteroidota bacterium]
MYKLIISILLGVFSSFTFFGEGDVTLTPNIPKEVKAGSEFTVEITIHKGDIDGFARFQQDLPVGFKAVEKKSANGEFVFENQKVKLQWMKLPFEKDIKISYTVQVGTTVKGEFNLTGKFSYIANNVVSSAELEAVTINVVGGDMASSDYEIKNSYKYQNVSLKNIDCIRQKPYLNENNEVIVNLLINKGDIDKFGKIQEQVPVGYNAISIKSKNSIFTFKNHIVKFMWMNMPSSPQFTVSYKLVPINGIPDQAFLIAGTFSYAENERTKIIDIAERNIDVSKFDTEKLVAEVKPQQTETQETKTEEVVKETTEQTQTELLAENKEEKTQVEPEKETKQEIRNEQKQTEKTVTQKVTKEPQVTSVPTPEQGVTYRVQIAAGHKLVKSSYFKKFNITDNVQTEIHQGWHKYTVGEFVKYKEARNYRIYIWNNTPINDAFVSAYNNGQRITVQEALMIANQKWYQ